MTSKDPTGGAFYDALLDDDPVDLYESAPCAYVSTLPDGTIVKANGTFLGWLGFAADDLVGRRRLQDLLAVGDRIFFETHVMPLLSMQGTARELAVELVAAGGEHLPVLANAVLRRNDDGQPQTIRFALFDATERRAYERELLDARRRAEESEATARRLAETLQASLLPPGELTIPFFEVAGGYHPAGDGSEVGGDFYDVYETGRGTWAVVLGDVNGKGAPAAVITSLLRHAIRAEALRTPYPSAVLAYAHDAMLRYHPDRFCTAVFAVVEPHREHPRITLSSGGHDLPLLVRGREVRAIGSHGSIIGMLDNPVRHDSSTTLEPGDAVVLYTDGVVEARRGEEWFGEERLFDLLRRVAGSSAAEIAAAIVDTVTDFQDGDLRDDTAVVVLRVPG